MDSFVSRNRILKSKKHCYIHISVWVAYANTEASKIIILLLVLFDRELNSYSPKEYCCYSRIPCLCIWKSIYLSSWYIINFNLKHTKLFTTDVVINSFEFFKLQNFTLQNDSPSCLYFYVVRTNPLRVALLIGLDSVHVKDDIFLVIYSAE